MARSLFLCLALWLLFLSAAAAAGGKWALLQQNLGIVAMHMQLLYTDKVVIFDRTTFGQSNISLPPSTCTPTAQNDCTAHSVEYDVLQNTVRPLRVLTDTWCSSGAVMANGTLVQTGGNFLGDRVVRVFQPCYSGGSCDWTERNNALLASRWYASNLPLPGGSEQIIIGGRGQFNYEFYPKTAANNKLFDLAFLSQTSDPEENNLYPLVIMNVDGNLFIFANNRAILFNYQTGAVVKTYPQLPDGNPRSYPSTGSGVLLPLKSNLQAEVLVCGGAPKGAYINAGKGVFDGALNTCGRISVNGPDPEWVMETMPLARVMGDMLLLPNGQVIIINGASNGTAGWEFGRNPVLSPVIYKPDAAPGVRFEVQAASTIPRMYHSSALLLRDGRVLVGGSNPHDLYQFGPDKLYPTELRLEAFSPAYLDPSFDLLRPKILALKPTDKLSYGKKFGVEFTVSGLVNPFMVRVTMISPSFTTHSNSMNQRLLDLGGTLQSRFVMPVFGRSTYQITVNAPANSAFANPGYYLLYVVHQDIPSAGIWVKLQ